MKGYLLLLFTLLCIGLGFALPWLAAARQDQTTPKEMLTYDAPQDLTATKADLFSRMSLVGSTDNILSLVGPSLRHTEEEAEEGVRDALEVLANQGWTIFSPARWSLQSAEPFLFTSSSETAIFEKEGKKESLEVASANTAAILWDCRLTTPLGEDLAFLLDDDLGLILSFAYSIGENTTSPYTLILPEENAMTAAAFCRSYYQTDFLTPTLTENGTWQIPLVNEAGETCFVPLYATKTELFFNHAP